MPPHNGAKPDDRAAYAGQARLPKARNGATAPRATPRVAGGHGRAVGRPKGKATLRTGCAAVVRFVHSHAARGRSAEATVWEPPPPPPHGTGFSADRLGVTRASRTHMTPGDNSPTSPGPQRRSAADGRDLLIQPRAAPARRRTLPPVFELCPSWPWTTCWAVRWPARRAARPYSPSRRRR